MFHDYQEALWPSENSPIFNTWTCTYFKKETGKKLAWKMGFTTLSQDSHDTHLLTAFLLPLFSINSSTLNIAVWQLMQRLNPFLDLLKLFSQAPWFLRDLNKLFQKGKGKSSELVVAVHRISPRLLVLLFTSVTLQWASPRQISFGFIFLCG